MNKTLLTGKPYVSSVETDLKKTFARIRKNLKEQKQKEEPKLVVIRPSVRER